MKSTPTNIPNVSLVAITPAWAQNILESKNGANRAMSQKHVDALAKEMEGGRWKLNGDTICLNGERLIDGQHRLAAVVQTGVTILSYVVDGLASDVFDTKDVGRRRSHGDTLGIRGEPNANRVAAALILIDRYLTGRMESSVNYSNTEIEMLLNEHPEVRASVQTSMKQKGLITPSVLDACHYLFSRKDPALADEFVDKIITGAGLQNGSPWYALRERLLRNSLDKAKLKRPYLMALCIKAWNAARKGQPVKCLRWRDRGENGAERFPVIQ